MKKYQLAIAFLLVFAFFGAANIADAHVTVWPKESTTGTYEKYTVRVPSEKDSNTTKVQLDFPQNVTVETVQPIAGWTYQFIKGADGRNTGIIWTATGDGIKAHEFFEFPFIGANPKQAASLSWKAHQTYADGSVVDWTGAPESDKPASITAIGIQSEIKQTNPTTIDHTHQNTSTTKVEWISIGLSVLALLLSLISLFRKKA
jgi:uncharacterized protein YcnI